MTAPVPPSSTYRVQFRPEFGFAQGVELVDYLDRLGVGALYASPLLAAAPGSTHGYDVVDPTRANPELGGEDGRRALAALLRERGMGFVLDIVPNHMCVAVPEANPWWWDLLRHGPDSRYARHFDVDWSRGPITLPVLGDDGDDGARALTELAVDGDQLTYHEHRFPIAPGTGHGTPTEVHARQHYRLISWRRGNTDLSYRRFFDVTTLAGVRVEDPAVFHDTHAEVLRWVAAGEVTGLRIDHPDGLADPGGYLRRLREAAGCWLVVEKILGYGESLPLSWPADGTTGYDALREVCGVFVDPAGEPALSALADGPPFAEVEEECRRLAATELLAAEVRRIAALAPDVPADAVAELMVAYPVYRSYLPEGRAAWDAALALAARRRPDLADALAALDRQVRADQTGELARRIQQTSGMVVAKGTEDTAFYRYPRLTALNEVGGDPDRFGLPPDAFHALAAARDAGWPATMTALSTHDTKRSEDVRARIAVLSELADEFATAVRGWTKQVGLSEPTLNLLAWQTLLGAWPITPDRLTDYLTKAAREAKVRTTWVNQDAEFEAEIATWPGRVLDSPIADEVRDWVERITGPGRSNSLGQKLLQLAGPGVPDVYQGSELWDLSLVDPDNRRPVDFAMRQRILDRVEDGGVPDIDHIGGAKLVVVHHTLRLRRDRPELFTGYRPVRAEGPAADHLLGFERSGLIAVATRLPVGLAAAGGWRDTVLPLPPGDWVDWLTGRQVPAAPVPLTRLFDRYPVALLVRDRP